MWADFHWHGRDWKQSHKETVKHSLELAYASGGLALGMMPNTDRPLTSLTACRDYLKLAKQADIPQCSVQMYVHLGLTKRKDQIKRAVAAYRKEPGICGLKFFHGRSTGNLAITEYNEQYEVWNILAQEGYDGVVVCHFEKELFMNDKWNSAKGKEWNTKARPEIAEIASFADGYEIITDVGFKGTVHVAHVSTPQVIDFVHNYNQNPVHDFKMSAGLTLHHLHFSDHWMTTPEGVWWKCNPSLRSEATRQGLEDRVKDGRVKILESDHAPHTHADKHPEDGSVPASGAASGTGWDYMQKWLGQKQMGEEQIDDCCY